MTHRSSWSGRVSPGWPRPSRCSVAGIGIAVIEERDDTSIGRGISIWPNALAALDRIGLGDEVREAGGRSHRRRVALA